MHKALRPYKRNCGGAIGTKESGCEQNDQGRNTWSFIAGIKASIGLKDLSLRKRSCFVQSVYSLDDSDHGSGLDSMHAGCVCVSECV